MPVPHAPSRAKATTAPPEPIYRELAALWLRQGRTVPGEPDPHWDRLAAAPERWELTRRPAASVRG
ncbi:hypothetical protein [Streptacidiphilus monticola]|jgi:hypothetical protein|uniref:DUF2934 domain-containing protein n=1 Tax=Streptacidiphilus monticola TaxID=2161674 RepID=A0ABW1G3A6_9ACTN